MEFHEWSIMQCFDDERNCCTVYVQLGHWKMSGFKHEAGLSLTEEQVGELIRDLERARLKLNASRDCAIGEAT
jgi:hypothetical protein